MRYERCRVWRAEGERNTKAIAGFLNLSVVKLSLPTPKHSRGV